MRGGATHGTRAGRCCAGWMLVGVLGCGAAIGCLDRALLLQDRRSDFSADDSGGDLDRSDVDLDAIGQNDVRDAGGSLGRFGTGRWRLGPIVALTSLNSAAADTELSLRADGLTAIFASRRNGSYDVFVAQRAAPTEAFAPPAELTGVNTPDDETMFESIDGVTAYLASDRPGGIGGVDLWLGRRPARSVPWTSNLFAVDTAASTPYLDWDPTLTPDGLTLYYAVSHVPGGPGYQDIVFSARSSTDMPFPASQLLTGVNSTAGDADPALSPDGKVLLLSSERSGGPGGLDIWYALRTGPSAFGPPQPMPSINSSHKDGEPYISPDGTELYFCSERPGGLGKLDIYRAAIIEGP